MKSNEDCPVHHSPGEFDPLDFTSREQRYVLRLYITGLTPRSTQAIATLRAVCEKHLAGRYDLEIIDVYQQPELAQGEQIVAVPTLVKELPLPLRHLIGDLSNEERVLVGLNIGRKPTS